jgi:hypothetical protein
MELLKENPLFKKRGFFLMWFCPVLKIYTDNMLQAFKLLSGYDSFHSFYANPAFSEIHHSSLYRRSKR